MTVKVEDHREQSAMPPQEESRVREATPSRERQEEEATPPQERRRKKIGRNERPSPGVLVGAERTYTKGKGVACVVQEGHGEGVVSGSTHHGKGTLFRLGSVLMLVGFVSLGE